MHDGVKRLHARYYDSDPAWVNGTEQFGSIVRKYLRPKMTILNLGAGPGLGHLHFDRDVYTILGVDPDKAIVFNQLLSHRVRGLAEALPFRNETFDLAYMDWVIEHLSSPTEMASEVFRVLKRQGRMFFRTGNLFHYSYAIAAVTPHAFHKALLGKKDRIEPYPTYYRMNTIKRVREVMKRAGFVEEAITMMEPDPAYVCMSQPAFLIGVAYERIVNRFKILRPIRANILGSFSKPAEN